MKIYKELGVKVRLVVQMFVFVHMYIAKHFFKFRITEEGNVQQLIGSAPDGRGRGFEPGIFHSSTVILMHCRIIVHYSKSQGRKENSPLRQNQTRKQFINTSTLGKPWSHISFFCLQVPIACKVLYIQIKSMVEHRDNKTKSGQGGYRCQKLFNKYLCKIEALFAVLRSRNY